MSDMKKLLEAMDTMSKAAKKPTGPKFTGYWKGTDKGTPGNKMVGSAEESIIKELDKAAKETVVERELAQKYKSYQENPPERLSDKLKSAWEKLSQLDDPSPKYQGMTHRRASLRQKLQKHRELGLTRGEVKEGEEGVDTVTMDVPLLIRVMEYAREDAKTDMDLHDVAERLIELSQEGRALTMQDYDSIMGQMTEVIAPTAPVGPGTTSTNNAQDPNNQSTDANKQATVNTQKNLSKLKMADPTLNPGIANQALQGIESNPNKTVSGAQLQQTQNLADLVGDALADPQKGSQLATILQQVQQSKKAPQ